jgi:hypothetical protein
MRSFEMMEGTVASMRYRWGLGARAHSPAIELSQVMTRASVRRFRSFLKSLFSQVQSGSRFVSSEYVLPPVVIQILPRTDGGWGVAGVPADPNDGITNWCDQPVSSVPGSTSPVSFSVFTWQAVSVQS